MSEPMHLPKKSDRSGFSSATHCTVDDERWPCTHAKEQAGLIVPQERCLGLEGWRPSEQLKSILPH